MLIDAFRALQAGKELANAKTWKQVQLWTSHLTVLLGAAVSIAGAMGYPIPLTGEQITTLVSAIAVLVGLFNSFTTVATTERMGVQPAADSNNAGAADAARHASVPGQWLRDLDDRYIDDVPVLKDGS